MLTNYMSELERAILEIREDLASIKAKLDSMGPRIGEATLCQYHSEEIRRLSARIYLWSGGLSVFAFSLGLLVPVITKHLKL